MDRTSLTVATDQGFCLTEPGPDGDLVTSCFSWDGQPADRHLPGDGHAADDRPAADHGDRQRPATLPLAPGARRRRRAGRNQRARGRRHQRGTHACPGRSPGRPRDGYPAGLPNPDDWQDGGAASADFLVDQAPGRYLYVRLRLTGDGTTTPVVHRIRLDFPRVTSADQLPAVYTQDPAAADFTERFLSLFDAAFDEADRAVERYPALLDPGGVPDEVLPWLGGLLGLVFDPGWDATIRRNLIAAAPGLYRGRGTPAALSQVIKIVFGVDVAISELAADRSWAALPAASASRLGSRPGCSACPGPGSGSAARPCPRRRSAASATPTTTR